AMRLLSLSLQLFTMPASKLHRTVTLALLLHLAPVPCQLASLALPGDIALGGLFPVHEKASPRGCGQISENRGVQRLEAMVYALRLANSGRGPMPRLRLGARLFDTCARDTHALEQSMDFVADRLSSLDGLSMGSGELRCQGGGGGGGGRGKIRQPVAGVIGAADSSVSIMIANILRLFKIPQISYASTSPELSDNSRFDFFFRVVPSDTRQAKAMADIVKQMGWNYVAALYDEGTYGERGFQEFKSHANELGICISRTHLIPRNHRNGSLEDIAASLLNMEKSRVVVAFCQAESLRTLFWLLGRSENQREARRLFWVASDGWGRKTDHLAGVEDIAEGAISLLPERRPVVGFDDYFKSLSLDHRALNPWWEEFWESHFKCSLSASKPGSRCSGKEVIGTHSRYEQEGLVPMVVDAVLAMAHAIDRMHEALCPDEYPKGCAPMNATLNGTLLRDFISRVNFTGTSGDTVRFNQLGDRESLYEVFQYQHRRGKGGFRYRKIGSWGGSLSLDSDRLAWGEGASSSPPVSVCSEPCGRGNRTVKPNKETATCCWECVPCDSKYQIVLNDSLCADCPLGSVPNRFYNACNSLPVETLRLDSVWGILPMTLSMAGLACTIFILAVFVRYNQTPLIRASGRELCYVMLGGAMMAFCTTFVMLAPPTPVTCGFFRVFNGLSLSVIYSAILTKTNRLSRIFNRAVKSLMKKPSYTSPRSQLVLCCCLVSVQSPFKPAKVTMKVSRLFEDMLQSSELMKRLPVQVIGDITWLGMELPRTRVDYPDRDHKVLRCAVDDASIIVSLLYNMILIALCTIYAFKTRNIPENFNEAKYIAFTMYSTCIVWLAFIPIYFGSLKNFRIKQTALCVCISISAAVTLGCMFATKVYIVLFQPHKNVRRANSSSVRGGSDRRPMFSPQKRPLLVRARTTTSGSEGEAATTAGGTAVDEEDSVFDERAGWTATTTAAVVLSDAGGAKNGTLPAREATMNREESTTSPKSSRRVSRYIDDSPMESRRTFDTTAITAAETNCEAEDNRKRNHRSQRHPAVSFSSDSGFPACEIFLMTNAGVRETAL
uniref:G_PROTEIN_RECEP_F3_4 domain-containing protein n=1 Tax=Macrostomum lignano TaxID=282301 RepID=A0A1I8IY49_9PLAT